MRFSGYDIIGDVHGCAQTLECLLKQLDYKKDGDVYFHPERQAIFVGDIVDRGPRIREALHIVKNMVDAGTAQCIVGNHEYNAVGYFTSRNPDEGMQNSGYVRARNDRHTVQLTQTLEQFKNYTEEWQLFLDWFKSLPIYLEFPGFRVVHACWDETLIREFEAKGELNCLNEDLVRRSADKKSFEGRFIDRLTRGTDMRLPDKHTMISRDGFVRHFFRTKFWARSPSAIKDIIFQPDPLPSGLENKKLSAEEKAMLLSYGEEERPVFFGHYWLKGIPEPQAANIVCLDYSAVKYGRLVAYRFDGETNLSANKFRWIEVERS